MSRDSRTEGTQGPKNSGNGAERALGLLGKINGGSVAAPALKEEGPLKGPSHSPLQTGSRNTKENWK
ncbi:hypothetical protein Ddc_13579 [Ditylenchus destructor]|nr:hypothetical protein Ddc_13579 [Ditylenchus destructor]